jgi:uncharacterized protein (UPF0276 family)
MQRISLGTDVPTYLPRLLEREGIQIDHIKVGLWQGLEGARREAALLPGLPILLHGDVQAAGAEPLSQRELDDLQALVEETRTPWFSVHLDVRSIPEFEALKKGGYQRRDTPRAEALSRIVSRVEQLKAALPVPILLENIPHWPADTLDLAADPEFISEVLLETECDMLLDLSHARVSGERLGLPDEDYLFRLPLGKVVEVHVSGPRVKGGMLRDAHEPMTEDDYALLDWLLRRHRPEAITLEYWKEPKEHATQLKRLREMLVMRET